MPCDRQTKQTGGLGGVSDASPLLNAHFWTDADRVLVHEIIDTSTRTTGDGHEAVLGVMLQLANAAINGVGYETSNLGGREKFSNAIVRD